jgi:hypothetical protein
VELGDVPRPMRHTRHGFALWGGPHFRLVKPQRDGAPLDLRLFLRPAFRRWRRAAAGDLEVGCRNHELILLKSVLL